MSRPIAAPILLRAATVWGTTVLGTRILQRGQSLRVGDGPEAIVAKPDGSLTSDFPIRAVGTGWELDARGAVGGELFLRGRPENPAELARSGAPIPIVAGDYGLVQYESLSIFFQFVDAPPPIKKRRRINWALLLSFVFSIVAVGGGLALIWAVTTPLGIPKPLELTSQAELALQFNIKEEELEKEPSSGKEKGEDEEDAPKEKKQPAKAIANAAGKLGLKGKEEKTEQVGDPRAGLGGMVEALQSDVGEEVRQTLSTITSVAEALGGLSSDRVVLGDGSGFALHGTGRGGGGVGPDGVPFGVGNLKTGGMPGGNGTGNGRGRGLGGSGKGNGSGDGSGSGDGERKLAGKEAPKAGQGLTPAQIQRVVMSRYGAFNACYEIALAREPNLKGGVTVRFTVSPDGSVGSVSIAGSTLSNPRVEGCINRQFSRLHFPAADKPTAAVFPLTFKPSH